jgi:hypothetical protein
MCAGAPTSAHAGVRADFTPRDPALIWRANRKTMAMIADVAKAAACNRLSSHTCPGSSATMAALWYASNVSQPWPPPYLPRCSSKPTAGSSLDAPKACMADIGAQAPLPGQACALACSLGLEVGALTS